MNEQPRIVNGWSQPSIFGVAALEITLKVGVIPENSHCQIQLEAKDPTTGTVLALHSEHSIDLAQIEAFVRAYSGIIVSEVERHTQPF